uniref:Uncharacterized protein n=1 Tax=viral metagenome TaxID=1070528 RepID=A0A6C0K217_9ZZZZ
MEAEFVAVDMSPLISEPNPKPKPVLKLICNDKIANLLANPKMILGISSAFFISYVSFLYAEGGFSQQFLHFGPGTTDQNTTQFLGIVLNTWSKVGLMYVAGFISSLMSTYYNYAMANNLHSYIWNRAIPKVPFSQRWTYVVVFAEPLFMQVLQIISFFTTLTLQLQFIVPQFIGSFIIEVPFTIQRLREKEFEFP